MHTRTAAVALVALLGALLPACGGGGGSGPPPTAPTLASVTPTQGPTGGGTPLTLTGTNFATPATVTVGGSAATSVVGVDGTTITCATPPGPSGPADVVVTVGGRSATLSGGFTYDPSPTVLSMAPLSGSTFGGTTVTLNGSGFTANAAGTNTVTIGGTPATSVNALSDTILTCVTPAGPAGPATVVVTNANGSGSLVGAFAWFEPIFAADGGGNPPPPWWDLFAVDPGSGIAYVIGPIGFGVTGMDFGPGGTLYGTTAPGGAGGLRQLITINPVTGAGTLVGPLDDSLMVNHAVPDCSFYLGALYGTDGPAGNFLAINAATGAVNVITPHGFFGPGSAFAVDQASVNVYYMTLDTAPLVSINPPTAFFTAGPPLSGFALPGGRMTAATFHNGTLYAVDAGPNAGPRQLVTVNTATGVMTPIGPPLPPLVGAIASRTR